MRQYMVNKIINSVNRLSQSSERLDMDVLKMCEMILEYYEINHKLPSTVEFSSNGTYHVQLVHM